MKTVAPLFTTLEKLLIRRARRKAVGEYATGLAHAGTTFLMAAVLITAIAIEWSLFYEVYSWLKAPAPGEDKGILGVALLSLTSLVMMIAFHVKAKADPDGPLVRTVGLLCACFLIIYAFGAGGVLAATLWFDGAKDIFSAGNAGDVAAAVGAFFQEAAAQQKDGWLKTFLEDDAFPLLSLAFVLGAGGLSICVLYLSHRLLESIEQKGPHLLELIEAHDRLGAARRLKALQKHHEEMRMRHRELAAILSHAERESAQIILSTIAQPLRIAESWANADALELRPGAPRFARVVKGRPEVNLNQDELRAMVERMKAYDTAAILADLRQHKDGDSS